MIRPALAILILPLLPSCKLVQVPFRVAGGVVEGTTHVVTAPGRAIDKRKDRKEAEKKKQEARERAARGSGGTLSGESPGFGSSPSLGGGTNLGGEGIPLEADPSIIPNPADLPAPPPNRVDPPLPEFDD
ncbi:hypothetical protein [Haloferula sp. A504]|jgi:hypothetical protein|uniref:hypothetical protein n=1 Tax=Haloferula sp. A504 TaxID=3373601 RepID=UPI0031C42EF6|nr:hypothetical protein [Verrucomicrobiaceae bacterium E54]